MRTIKSKNPIKSGEEWLLAMGKHMKERKWFRSHFDSYNEKQYRIEMVVVEGSPPKGVLLIWHDGLSNTPIVFGLSSQWAPIIRWVKVTE